MMRLRSYQTECIAAIWAYFMAHFGNPVCALPTGTGKSVCIAGFLISVYEKYPGQKVLVLTHVKELISQNYGKLVGMWPTAPAGIYSAGLKRKDVLQRIIFAGIASVAKRAHEFGHVDLIIVDECHLVSPSEATMYRAFFNALKTTNPNLKVIGFTATAWRLGHGKITEGEDAMFTDICFDITTVEAFNRLIAEGFLCPVVPRGTATKLDTDGVHMRGGEFIAKELQNAVDKDHITRAALNEAMAYKDVRKSWLIFASGVEHAIHIDQILQEFGLQGAAVHSKMETEERDNHIARFKAGEYQYLVNNNILTTGFDHPPTDLIICLRPTASSVLWVQMLGRGTRPYDPNNPGDVDPAVFDVFKRNCLVLDFAANSKRLGQINDPVIPRKKGEKGGPAPVKECDKCRAIVHASARFCNTEDELTGLVCTHEFIFKTKLKQGASDDSLIKGDLPVVEVFHINQMTYTPHYKLGKPPSVKVSYYCGRRVFREYVCLEHPGGVAHKARSWVTTRLSGIAVETTESLMAVVDKLSVPTHIRVWTNQQYPTILAHCFDGTAFGTKTIDPMELESLRPTVEKLDGGPNIALPLPAGMTYDAVSTEVDEDGEAYGF